jgi:dTDP-4-amino-4,6-dideoxygalactose transaminase
MIITKTALNFNKNRRELLWYESARSALISVLKQFSKDTVVLLPAYIGYSKNEGSGIFDPILESRLNYVFYRMDKNLHIDANDYEKKLLSIKKGKSISLFVHYFGYKDPNIEKLCSIANDNGSYIIEDCAHALYTDYEDHACGHLGDASIYSLHKMLPYSMGGMLKLNSPLSKHLSSQTDPIDIWGFDFHIIAKKRKENARFIEQTLNRTKGIRILRPTDIYSNQTPQTFPILFESINRDDFYFTMNEMGFGIVSLYHTMITPPQAYEQTDWEKSKALSKTIVNLPVHQDADTQSLNLMCRAINDYLLNNQ